MNKRMITILMAIMALSIFSGCGYIKSEIKAGKIKKGLEGESFKKYYILSLFASHSEAKAYLLMESEDQRNGYLKEFWMMYDPDISSTRNSFYAELLKRYSYAKLKFPYMRRSGEKTDMGRMYIKYGAPVEIQRNPQDIEREDFQEVIVWEYEEPKMFNIGFKDENGTGSFNLIPNYEVIPTVTGKEFRHRTLKEVREWRVSHEENN
ncbi:GWxTD domain-containing protein [bacterium]|nr:GWxTD domain-containing protein [bacterium]